jgi:hypothetical protein
MNKYALSRQADKIIEVTNGWSYWFS